MIFYGLQLGVGLALSFVLGQRFASRRAFSQAGAGLRHPMFAVMLAWLLLTLLLRKLADTDAPGWMLAEVYSQQGTWYTFGCLGFFMLGLLQRHRAELSPGVAPFTLGGMGVFLAVLTLWRTIPIYPFVHDTLKRDENGYIRQSTGATCAPVSLGNLMEQGYG